MRGEEVRWRRQGRDRGEQIASVSVSRPDVTITHCGRICFDRRKVNLSQVFAGQNVGITQVGDRIWLVSFMQYDLGYFDDETCRLEPIESRSDLKCYRRLQNELSPM